ncbi:MAG: hypothetical protein HC876_08510 [Chloroflexaceae bacterium]|nr:hypothetical protein [Chloroflexaceae bacterium]
MTALWLRSRTVGGIRQNAGDFLPRGSTEAAPGLPGPITLLDTLDVLPFDNTISVVENVTVADLFAILGGSGNGLDPDGIYQVSENLRLEYQAEGTGDDLRYQLINMTVINNAGDEVPLVQNGEVVDGAPTVAVITNSFVADREFATDRGLTDQTDLVDATGTRLLYEQPLREYLATFPEENGVPTIQEDDARYQYPDGDGRISIAE